LSRYTRVIGGKSYQNYAGGGADLCLTDPPYKHKSTSGQGLARARKIYQPGGVVSQLSDFDLSEYADVLIAAAPMLIAFHSRDLVQDYAALARSSGRTYDLHVWHKPDAPPFTGSAWMSDVEYIALSWSTRPGWARLPVRAYSKVWTDSNRHGSDEHPTGKPLALMKKYIRVLDAKVIVDPFAGSGTTLRAAKDLGRRSIGCEIDEAYCSVIARRMAQEPLAFGTGEPCGA